MFTMAHEKDDICLEGTPATPRMIVLFKDYENPQAKKEVMVSWAPSIYPWSKHAKEIALKNLSFKNIKANGGLVWCFHREIRLF